VVKKVSGVSTSIDFMGFSYLENNCLEVGVNSVKGSLIFNC
jgi:hypothetical protein